MAKGVFVSSANVKKKTRLAAGFSSALDPGSLLREVRDDALAEAFASSANAPSWQQIPDRARCTGLSGMTF